MDERGRPSMDERGRPSMDERKSPRRRGASAGRWLAPSAFPVVAALLIALLGGQPFFGERGLRAQEPGERFAMEVVGQLGAAPFSVSAERQRVFVGAGQRIKVVDVSDPLELRFVGESDFFRGRVEAVLYNEGFVYAGAENGFLHVVDARDLSAPRRGIDVDLPGQQVLREMEVRGDLLAAVTADATLHLLSISQPDQPLLLRSISAGGVGWRDTSSGTVGLLLHGDHALVRDVTGVSVVDISDLHRPRRVSRFERPVLQYTRGMALIGDHLFVATTTDIRVVDVQDPRRPRQVTSLSHAAMSEALPIRRMRAEGERLYVLQEGARRWVQDEQGTRLVRDPGRITVVDAANPRAPTTIASHEVPLETPEFDVDFGRLWMADEGIGLTGLDLSDAAAPEPLGSLAAEFAYGLSTRGSLTALIVGQPGARDRRLDLVDSSEPTAMRVVAALDQVGPAQQVALEGDRLYLRGPDSLAVATLTEALTPTLVGRHDGLGASRDMALFGQRAYVVTSDNGPLLRSLDLRDPASPRETSAVTTTGEATAVVVGGGRVYAAVASGVDVFDLSDPDRPRRLAHVPVLATDDPDAYPGPRPIGAITDLALRDGLLYLLASGVGIVAYDLADPEAPLHGGIVEHYNGAWLRIDPSGRLHVLNASRNDAFWTYTTHAPLDPGAEVARRPALHQLVAGGVAQGLEGFEERSYAALGPAGLAVLAPIPPERLALTRTPRASATAPDLPSATPRPGAQNRPFKAYLPKLEQPLARSRKPLSFELVKLAGGPTELVARSGDLVAITEGHTLKLLDATRPQEVVERASLPIPLEPIVLRWRDDPDFELEELPAGPLAMLLEGDRLYLLTGLAPRQLYWAEELLFAREELILPSLAQILTYDISAPASPRLLDRIELPGVAYEMLLVEDQLYVSLFTDVDEDWRYHGTLAIHALDADGLPRPSGNLPTEGPVLEMQAQGSMLVGLAATSWEGLRLLVIDATVRQQPTILGNLETEAFLDEGRPAMAFQDDAVLIFSPWGEALIFDISNPREPEYVDALYLPEIFWADEDPANDIEYITDAILLDETLVLMDRYETGLLVTLDLGSPLVPRPGPVLDLGATSASLFDSGIWPGRPWTRQGSRMWVTGGDAGGLHIVDLEPAPRRSGGWASIGSVQRPLAVGSELITQNAGFELSIWDGFRLPDFARLGGDPAAMYINDYAVDQKRAFLVGAYRSAFRWLDLTRPETPLSGGLALESPSLRRIDGSGDTAYIVEESGGLLVYRIRDADAPELLGSYYGPGILHDVAVQGGLAYLASGPAGVGVVRVDDPENMGEVGHLDSQGDALILMVEGSRGYLFELLDNREHQLSVLDLGQPEQPRLISSMPLDGSVGGVPQLVSDLIFVTHQRGLLAIDISLPERPSLAGEIPDATGPMAVTRDGRWLAVAQQSGQLALYRIRRE